MLNSLLLWCICVTIALMPWYIVRFSVAGIPTTLLECLALLTFGVWCVREVMHIWQLGLLPYSKIIISQLKQYWFVILPVVLFVGASTIAVVASANLTAALGIYKAYVIEPLLFGLVIWTSIDRRRDWWIVVAALLLAALQVSLTAIGQYFLGWPNFAPAELLQGRASAMYNTANAIGLFIGPTTLLAITLIIGLWSNRRKVAIALLIVVLINLTAIGLSQSTGAAIALLLSLFIGVGLWLAVHRGWLSYRIWMMVTLFGVLVYVSATILFMIQFNQPPNVANPYTRPGFSTFTVRQCTWEGTRNLLADRPWFGSGLAGFADEYLNHATCDAEPLVYPHNLVLNFWVETGLLGLVSIVSVIVVWFSLCGKLLFRGDMHRWIGIGLSLCVCYWLIHGLVDVPYFKNDLSLTWWILFSMTVVASLRVYSLKA